MRQSIKLWAIAATACASPGWACATVGGPSVDALALGYFAQEIEDATRFDGRRPGIRIDLVDLDGDGCVDAIVHFRSAFLGGARGCSTHILDMASDPPREIGGMLACEVRTATSSSEGWLDLVGDTGGWWAFANGSYRWREK